MLSGEGNGIDLITEKATLHVQHTFFCSFLCRCFARLQRETSRNFVVTRFMEEIVVRLVNFFTASHIHLGGH